MVAGSKDMHTELRRKYKIKDLGEIKLILGIRSDHDRTSGLLTLSQGKYLKCILERHRMIGCTPKYTPLPPGIILTKSVSPLTDEDTNYMRNKLYQEVLGTVIYAQVGTHPDLSFAVASLSRFSSNPGKAHWQVLMHILQYIKANLHYKLWYGGPGYTSVTPTGYVDSDFAADIDTRCSVSGQIFIQGGGPTTWGAKYQLTTSTTEAEYMAMSHHMTSHVPLSRSNGCSQRSQKLAFPKLAPWSSLLTTQVPLPSLRTPKAMLASNISISNNTMCANLSKTIKLHSPMLRALIISPICSPSPFPNQRITNTA